MPTSALRADAVCAPNEHVMSASSAAMRSRRGMGDEECRFAPRETPVDVLVSTAMAAKIIDGKAVAARTRGQVARDVEAFTKETGVRPGLATVLVGEDAASAIYVGGKQK